MTRVEPIQDAAHLLTIFAVCDAFFAVSAQFVQEIIRPCPITPVHHAPGHVAGIINLRGRIVTVLDPALRIGLGRHEAGEASRILILDWKGEQLGLLVARVRDVIPVDPERLLAPPPNLRVLLGPFASQVFQVQDSIVSTLNLEALLSADPEP